MYRVLRPLLRGGDLLPSWLAGALEVGAAFSSNLISVLALLTVSAVLYRIVVRGDMVPLLQGRVAFAAVALLYLPLSYLLLLLPGPTRLSLGTNRTFFLLHLCFLCLAGLTALSTLPLRTGGRLKLGAMLLLLPLFLHFAAFFRALHGGDAGALRTAGQGAVLLALLASAPCFLPGRAGGPRYGYGLAAGAALSLTALAGVLIVLDGQLAAQLLQHALGLQLPTRRLAQALLLVALGHFAFTVVALLFRGGAYRLRGCGLLLIGLGGYGLQENYQLLLLLLGLLCITQSADLSALSAGVETGRARSERLRRT